MIRSIWVLVAGAVLTGVFSTCVVLNGLFRRPNRACWCDRLSRRWTRLVLKTAGVRVKVFDADRVDWSQPAVVVANHQSWFDVFTLAAYLPGSVRCQRGAFADPRFRPRLADLRTHIDRS